MAAAVAATISPTVTVPIIAALVTGFFAWYVQAWRLRREASDQATKTLRLYRDPLLRAAFDLQSRLYNIAARGFLSRYWIDGNEEQRFYARWSTLWLFGQYLGWVEILRREVQYLDLGSRTANRRLQRRLNEVSAALASDSRGGKDSFIIFRSDQRAIGEFMVVERPSQTEHRPDCMGYSEFNETLATLEAETASSRSASSAQTSVVISWAERFARDLEATAETSGAVGLHHRLVGIQRRLIDLIDVLDADRLRYPHLNFRGKLPELEISTPTPPTQVANFIWSWMDPWEEVDRWARSNKMTAGQVDGAVRSYRGRRGLLGRRSEVTVTLERGWIVVDATTARFRQQRRINGSLRARRARKPLNDLLRRFDRPVLKGEATVPDRMVEWGIRRVLRLRAVAGDHES